MLELQEASENMLLCSPESCYLGATVRPAEHCDRGHHKQFTQVVAWIVCPGIGDVVEGGEKDFHAENKLQKGGSCPRIHPPQNCKTSQIRSDPKRDSPVGDATSVRTKTSRITKNRITLGAGSRHRFQQIKAYLQRYGPDLGKTGDIVSRNATQESPRLYSTRRAPNLLPDVLNCSKNWTTR